MSLYRTCCLLLSMVVGTLATTAQAEVNTHGAVLTVASPEAFGELGHLLPQAVETEVREMVRSIAGPVVVAATSQEPFGLILDWQRDEPVPTAFIVNPKMDAFFSVLSKLSIEPKQTDDGIYEVTVARPLYFREQNNCLYISPSREAIKHAQVPAASLVQDAARPVTLEINLTKIPASSKSEIANVLLTRMMPLSDAGPDEITADNLAHRYTQRLLQGVTRDGESLTLQVSRENGVTQLQFDVNGRKLVRSRRGDANLLLPTVQDGEQAARVHLDLQEEEVAYLSWWAQSLQDRAVAEFQQATIEERANEAAIVKLMNLVGNTISQSVQKGKVELYMNLVGEEKDIPVFAASIASGDQLERQLKEFVSTGSVRDLGLSGVEWNLDQVGEFRIHRFTFADPTASNDDPVTVELAVAEQAIYVSPTAEGHRAMRAKIAELGTEAKDPQPIAIRIPGLNLAGVLGWKNNDAAAANEQTATIQSAYTAEGLQFTVRVGE